MAKSSQGKQSGSGGGARSRQTPVRVGPPATKVISPSAAANLGQAKGDHVMGKGTVQRPSDPLVQGTRGQVASGNTKALAVGRGAPGADRTVYRSGSQGQHGPAAGSAAPQGRDILSDFGPEGGNKR